MATIEDLNSYLEALRVVDRSDAAEFTRLLVLGMKLLDLSDKDIAREFGASMPSVSRWKSGTNAPHPLLRVPVFEWLAQRTTVALHQARSNRES